MISGAVLSQAAAGVVLVAAALARAAALGWRPAMARRDGGWPLAPKLLAAGAVLLALALLQAAFVVAYVYAAAAISYAQ